MHVFVCDISCFNHFSLYIFIFFNIRAGSFVYFLTQQFDFTMLQDIFKVNYQSKYSNYFFSNFISLNHWLSTSLDSYFIFVDFANTVCVAARFQMNGSFSLETQFCNESLRALCHRTVDIYNGSSKTGMFIAFLRQLFPFLFIYSETFECFKY